MVLPDSKGFRLLDALSGAPLRTVNRSEHERDGRVREVLSLVADAAGRRFVTIERVFDEALVQDMDEMPAWDGSGTPGEYQVILWDLDRLDQPTALQWPPPPRRGSGPRAGTPPPFGVIPPLVAISPDGRLVAVAPLRGTFVQLFSGEDGRPVRIPGEDGKSSRGSPPIQTQIEMRALALGPNSLLAAAGSNGTAGGGTVKLFDTDTRALLASLTPTQQHVTSQMRFSPQGTLLALIGWGPIELWDPLAHNLVAVLRMRMSDQPTDLAFSPDGRTLAAGGRVSSTSIWTVTDSAARTQLGGFDERPSSLAFGDDGTLAGGVRDGGVWSWRSGRCPNIGSPQAESLPAGVAPAVDRPAPRAVSASSLVRGAPPDPPTSATGPPPSSPARFDPRRGDTPGRGGPSRDRPSNPASVAFDAEGRLVAHDNQGLRIWTAGSNQTQAPTFLRLETPQAPGPPWLNWTPMARTPDGRLMALVRSTAVLLWSSETPDRIRPVTPPPRSIAEPASAVRNGPRRDSTAATDSPGPRFFAVQVAPHGDRIYLIDEKNTLHAWALERTSEGCQARELVWKASMPEGIFSLALRPDGAVLAIGDRSGTVTLVDTARGTITGRIKPPSAEAEGLLVALAFSPDGRDLAVGTLQGTILIWSVAKPSPKEPRLRLPGNRGMITILAFDAHGRRLASAAGFDPLVEVWDLDLIRHELTRLGIAD